LKNVFLEFITGISNTININIVFCEKEFIFGNMLCRIARSKKNKEEEKKRKFFH